MFSTDMLGNDFFHADMVESDQARLDKLRLLGFVAETMN